jgi:hypothetical protein
LARLQGYTLNGQSLTGMITNGQAFITPQGADASYYYIPGSGPVMTGYTPEQREAIESQQRDARVSGIGSVAALVAGGAALGGLGGAATGGATTGGATTYPLASAGGPITATPVAGGVGAGTTAAAGAAGAAGAGGLGLGGWLTVGALGAQALQGNEPIVSNQTNNPPAYIAPYLSEAAEQARNLYGQGNYVAPVTQSAIDYTKNVLGGGFMGSNPYLDATFNKAAGAVTNQVQSNFGLSGRNPRGIDAAGFAQEGYNDLANQIYGGNYQAERQRQQQLVPYAGQLGAYTNPGTGFDDYVARLRNLSGGYGTSTSTTPTQSNWLGGLAGLGMLMMGS